MTYNVKFLRGTAAAYAGMSKDATTFYFTDDGNLYLGDVKLSNGADLTAAIERIATNEGSIEDITESIGTLTSLSTTAKTDLVSAINEVFKKAGDAQTAGAVTLTSSSSAEYAQVYTLSQGGQEVGTINIPKDMVVQSGSVEVDPDGKTGTFIVLTLANATNDKIYIPVTDLIDIYTAAENATEVQLAVTADGVISATLVNDGVTADKLATDAVTTDKIANANVTRVKLATDVTSSLDKADSAVQKVEAGNANGEIKVDGIAVKVTGLGSAAFTNSDAYDAAGAAAAVLGNADTDTKDSNTVYGAKKYADSLDAAMDARVDALETAVGSGGSVDTKITNAINALDATVTQTAGADGVSAEVVETDGKLTSVKVTIAENIYDTYGAAATVKTEAAADATTKANAAASAAKAYTDEALTWGTF